MPRFIVSFNERRGLAVELDGQPIGAFLRSTYWKIRLPAIRALAPTVCGQSFLFPDVRSMAECLRVIEAFKVLERYGYSVVLSKSYIEHQNASNARIEERVLAGLAIKRQDASVLDRFEEFRIVVDKEMTRRLRDKQAWDAFFMTVMGRSANFSVPGSGKTAAVLGMFAYLHAKGMAKRVVVVSPINAFQSWRDEWEACFGPNLRCRSFSFHDYQNRTIRGEKRKYFLQFNSGEYNLILINYESCCGLEDELSAICSRDTLLVYDEVHKVKRIGGARATSALAIAQESTLFVGLTGTPIPNSYCDIYNLLHFISPTDYEELFGFKPDNLKAPDAVAVARINDSVQPFFCRTNKRMLGVPEANDDIVLNVRASIEENGALLELKHRLGNSPLAMIVRVLQLESDERMLRESVLDEDAACLFDEEDSLRSFQLCAGLPQAALAVGTSSKMNKCLSLVTELVAEGKAVIVWCIFIQSIENLSAELAHRGASVCSVHGGVDPETRQRLLDGFKEGKYQVLITNPHTLAESISLHGVCHDAVYYEYSYNLIHLLQSKDRIHRLGLPNGQYTQYYFMQTIFDLNGRDWSLDANIYQRLLEKERVMLDAIDRDQLEVGSVDGNDLEIVFRGLFDD